MDKNMKNNSKCVQYTLQIHILSVNLPFRLSIDLINYASLAFPMIAERYSGVPDCIAMDDEVIAHDSCKTFLISLLYYFKCIFYNKDTPFTIKLILCSFQTSTQSQTWAFHDLNKIYRKGVPKGFFVNLGKQIKTSILPHYILIFFCLFILLFI